MRSLPARRRLLPLPTVRSPLALLLLLGCSTPALAQRGSLGQFRGLGRGCMFRTFRSFDGRKVIKAVQREVNIRPARYRVRDRSQLARLVVDGNNQLLAAGLPVLRMEQSARRPHLIVQDHARGLRINQLSPEARQRAATSAWELSRQARKILGRRSALVADPNPENFTFDRQGNVVQWFDPVRPQVETHPSWAH